MLTFFQDGLFKGNHLILLLLSLIIILLYILINKKYKLSFKTNLTFIFFVVLVNEIFKVFIGMETTDDGTYYYHPENLPFHLCGFQFFLVTALMFFVKNANTKQKILGFMSPSMCIGALIAMFIPSDGTSLTDVQVYRFFIYHAALVAFGFYLVLFNQVKITFKVYLRNLMYLATFALFCMWLNGVLIDFDVNYLFLSKPPVEGLPILNLNNGYWTYLFTLMGIAIILLTFFHVPFILSNIKHKKEK